MLHLGGSISNPELWARGVCHHHGDIVVSRGQEEFPRGRAGKQIVMGCLTVKGLELNSPPSIAGLQLSSTAGRRLSRCSSECTLFFLMPSVQRCILGAAGDRKAERMPSRAERTSRGIDQERRCAALGLVRVDECDRGHSRVSTCAKQLWFEG